MARPVSRPFGPPGLASGPRLARARSARLRSLAGLVVVALAPLALAVLVVVAAALRLADCFG